MRLIVVLIVALASVLPGTARAQSALSGSIAGVVRDTTGAVLPGVTVEASSPALIEKVRTGITDAQGQFKLLELRPGTYTVTFTLPGFATVKREGVELSTGFTATVNADLKVGSLEETVTVTGASPVVDTHNARQQSAFTRQVLDTLPTAQTVQAFASLTLGANLTTGGTAVTQDVGGNMGESSTQIGIHGSDGWDMKLKVDGMNFGVLGNSGGGMMRVYRVNQSAAQETVLETGGMSAESETGGVQMNVVPKEGGNTFRGTVTAEFSNDALQASNLTDTHRARGLTSAATVRKIYDVGGGVGGRIRRDKLWFFASARSWGSQEYQPATYYNKSTNPLFYIPDLSKPGYTNILASDATIRVTWQAGARHKINLTHSQQDNCLCDRANANNAPESVPDLHLRPTYVSQVSWTYPRTNRLLFEAGGTLGGNYRDVVPQPETAPDAISILELATNVRYGSNVQATHTNAYSYGGLPISDLQWNQRVTMSYVTGSHAFKTGLSLQVGEAVANSTINQALSYSFRNQLPVSLTEWAVPFKSDAWLMPNMGIFAQDQWTVRRLTLNLGIRYDALVAYTPDFQYPGGRFIPAFTAPAVKNVPNFKDLSPRFGGAIDLFGDGRTAIKGYFSRYVQAQSLGIALLNHPGTAMVVSADRTWADANGNFVPDCDFQTPGANGECGALSNSRFGQPIVNQRFADDILKGFDARTFNWQSSVSVQHELTKGLALNAGYFRTWYGNLTVRDNTLVTPADHDPFCITAPSDGRLPGGGGYRVCELYDVTPAKFGLVFNEFTQASNFGERTQVYDGVDLSLNARFARGALLAGGVNLGRTMTDNCAVVDFQQQFCKNGPPFLPQVKVSGSYPVPWGGLQLSGVYQDLPGFAIQASYVASNAEVASSLGRNLAACGGRVPCTATATANLLEPNTMFEDRVRQLDLRVAKNLRVARVRIQGRIDIYNIFNVGTVLASNTRYGTAWLTPTSIIGGRLFKVGGQVEF